MVMPTLVVETFILKPDKLGEYRALEEKYATYVKEHPEVFKEQISHKVFSHRFGGKVGGHVEMSEFNNLADAEKCGNQLMQDKGFVMTILQPSMDLAVAGSYSIEIWDSFP
jgi:hypothetical protein